MSTGVILYGPRGEAVSTPQTRRMSALQRQQSAVRAKFDAAQTTNENSRHWSNADYLGPNSELNPQVRRDLRSRARYECANNTYAAGMIRTLANDTIGTGPGLQVTDRTYTKDDATAIEDAFWEWCVSVSLPQKLREMRKAKSRDGETFAQFFTNPRARNPVQLDVVPFEADYVATSHFNSTLSNILDGLIIDDFGNVIAYNVLREHPGEMMQTLSLETDTIPASEIIHLYHSDRPGTYRGCPEITPALPLYAQLRKYTLAVIRAAESAAIPSWIVETQQPPSEMVYGDPFDTLETERGMGLTLPAGYKMNQLKAEHPTSTYPQFKREIVAEIARCLGMPYNVAAGDSSSYNYSSGRLDHRTYYKALRVERSYIECNALDVIFAKWWEEASGIPDLLPASAFKQPSPIHEWRWDGDEHVDPTKESAAAVERVSFGLTSLPDEVARLGSDIAVVHRKNAEAFGLPEAEYRKRLADKFFGATIASSSQDTPETPASNPYQNGGGNA